MSRRLKLEDVSCEVEGQRSRASVRLRNSELTHIGLANGINKSNCDRIVALATINAVRMFARLAGETNFRVALSTVTVVPAQPHPLSLVSMTLDSGEGRKKVVLSGSAPVLGDPYLAIARATLHGLNRQIERLL